LKGFTTDVVNTMMLARRTSSTKLYDTYTRRWQAFCALHNLSYLHATVAHGLEFLQTLVHQGLGYSAINTARSAIEENLLINPSIFALLYNT
jgi:hypothetical protein